MPPRHPLYLAWLAEPVADGERRPRAPLHLTLVPPFAGDEAAALDAARSAAAGRAPVAAAATGTARFGPRRDVPVVLVEPSEGMRALHEALMDAVAAAGVDLGHARHVRAGFSPHLSLPRRDGGPPPLAPGDPILVDHVALLRRGDGTVVVGRVPLGPGGRGPDGRGAEHEILFTMRVLAILLVARIL